MIKRTKIKLLILGLASSLIIALSIMVGIDTSSTLFNSQRITSAPISNTNKMVSSQQPLVYNGVNQQQLQSCIKAGGNCIKAVPGLAACMQAGHNCNDLSTLGNPTLTQLADPVASNATLISKAKALSIIDTGHSGIKSTSANITTYGHMHKIWPALAANTIVNPSRPVWVVKMTFLTPHNLKGAWIPKGVKVPKVSGYVSVIDATTGIVIDTGTF